MGKKEKLLNKARNSPNNFAFDDLIRLAELHGYKFSRQNGAHKLYKHDNFPTMNFQNKNGKAKDYQIQQLLDIIDP